MTARLSAHDQNHGHDRNGADRAGTPKGRIVEADDCNLSFHERTLDESLG